MQRKIITEETVKKFFLYLQDEERSKNTIDKYLRDVRAFASYVSGSDLKKENVITYKNKLLSENYSVNSIN